MKKPGEFLKQKQRHKERQKLYDAVSRLRNKEETFMNLKGKRVKVLPYDDYNEYGLSLVYIRGDKTPTLVYSYIKDGRVIEYNSERVVGVNSIKEWLGTIYEQEI